MVTRLPEIITAEWALHHGACYYPAEDFAKKWPDGLEVTRKNIHLVRHYFARKRGYAVAGWDAIAWLKQFIPTRERQDAFRDGEVSAYLEKIRINTRRANQDYSRIASNLMADALGLP